MSKIPDEGHVINSVNHVGSWQDQSMTDAHSEPDETTAAGQNSDTFPVSVRPGWEPCGEEAEKVVDVLIRQSRWTTKGPKATKYRVVVASLLKAMQ
jgi:hypothetical protein